MTETEDTLEALAALHGILPFYWDISGTKQVAERETKRNLLEAMGVRASSDEELRDSLAKERARRLDEVVPPVIVCFEEQLPARLPVRLPRDKSPESVSFRVTTESGSVLESSSRFASEALESDGAREALVRQFPFGEHLPAGYHRVEARVDDRTYALKLIVAPSRCYLPSEQPRMFGFAAQLYSLRSEENWGIGDFVDLSRAAARAAKTGADFFGLNPLHALFNGSEENVSPYSPSSRMALTTFYISIDEVPELAETPHVVTRIASAELQGQLAALRARDDIGYAEIWNLKRPLLEELFETFNRKERGRNSIRERAYEAFLRTAGPGLERTALYEALREHFLSLSKDYWGWPVWPEEYRSPNAPAVSRFAQENRRLIELYRYIQFLADEQLSQAQQRALDSGMRLGLYLDFALGTNIGGAETWAYQDLFALGASMGAPPDELGPQGQNWGLPPYVPARLRAAGYEPFIQALRFSMRSAGALRIDHMMSLFRLFWIPPGKEASEGAYVLYPFEDLLGIVTLESRRNRCVVIGEDLGTVPDEVREGMKRTDILSYKVLFFMREKEGFTHAADFPKHALVVSSTHDLPTLRSFWRGIDIDLRETLRILPEERLYALMREMRATDRAGLTELMTDEGYFPEGIEPPELLDERWILEFHRFLARTPSLMQAIQLEDLTGQLEQVNLPGTVNEHPNWRRKLRTTFEALLKERSCEELVEAVAAERGRKSG